MSALAVVADPERSLADVADEVHALLKRGRDGSLQHLDASLAIGHNLIEARERLKTDQDFGGWCREQTFPFSRQWGWTLRQAALNEAAVRAAVLTQVDTGQAPNIKKALAQLRGETPTESGPLPDLPPDTYRAIVADPPWQYGNTSTRGAAEDHYRTMTTDELCALDVEARAADDAHLYLWTTNGFLRQAFDIMDAWGFDYKTTLTWVKPQMGMGNYFRIATEHVLFGVRGGMRTGAKDLRNWFESPRGKHSAKPDCFYDLVEVASPGPYLEMFARRRRLGWESWGDEA